MARAWVDYGSMVTVMVMVIVMVIVVVVVVVVVTARAVVNLCWRLRFR